MKGTAIYHSPFGEMQLDWEDGAVTALKLAPVRRLRGSAERADRTGIPSAGRVFFRDAPDVRFSLPPARHALPAKGLGGAA